MESRNDSNFLLEEAAVETCKESKVFLVLGELKERNDARKLRWSVEMYNPILRTSECWDGLPEAHVESAPLETFKSDLF